MATAVVMALAISGCGRGADAGAGAGVESGITVLAAASLTDAFSDVATAFEAATPGLTVEVNPGASSSLREQILAGAPGDVFAPADNANMAAVVKAGAAVDPADFVANELQIVVPAGNPAGVTGLADFADADLLLGLCAEEVPCGQFARRVLATAGVTPGGLAPAIDTNEPDVRSLLTKVEAGELDAGIVYRTDVLAAGDAVEGIDIPADANVAVTYAIAALTGAANPEGAAAFVAFVLSDEGQAILASFGFRTP